MSEFENPLGHNIPCRRLELAAGLVSHGPTVAFLLDIRKVSYTANAAQTLNRYLQKVIKTPEKFSNYEAAIKFLFLAIRNAGIH